MAKKASRKLKIYEIKDKEKIVYGVKKYIFRNVHEFILRNTPPDMEEYFDFFIITKKMFPITGYLLKDNKIIYIKHDTKTHIKIKNSI